MTKKWMIRETTSGDIAQVLALYPLAFPEEELRPVVLALLEDGLDVLSLAGFDGDALVAHVLFTICETEEWDRTGALLAPLGVIPLLQRLGLGSSLVRAGLERLEKRGIKQVFVLGDPAYYQRFGFSPERQVLAPYPIPEEWADAWQSILLAAQAPLAPGRLSLPEPWMNPVLWKP
ncbi:GNAT family N-acetyltransferase [Pseudohalocynthiibacter aestuariivivens]|uniref:GNAT family N-acetyltransferase n=1 Tax=Pseudohalocynthiibacter aestuariivivens TaxID=1591409 RepID=A0ABV5JDG0_9RHOB|nr:N-acetyltransferase [Pseudohalocynthiibacter aestuariivivens]MCK0104616.1 N-acetyltransferase [Pseudohalocynthiibacter sp. F2068]